MNHYGIEPLSSAFHGMVPTVLGTLVACVAWLYCCRFLCRSADAAHKQAVEAAGTASYLLAGRGAPSDRLYFRSMAAALVSFMFYLGAYWFGLTPASQSEREFIAMVIQAGEDNSAIRSQVKALGTVIQNDYYVSRRHFMLAERIRW